MEWIDTHAHLDDERLLSQIDQVVARAQAAGVTRLVAIATTASSSQVGQQLAARFPGVAASVGIHPNYTAQVAAGDWDKICSLAQGGGFVALGETGLDRHWDDAPWDLQRDYFDRHLRLSRQTGLPLVIHTRDCMPEMLAVLREEYDRHGALNGVLHSFTGSADEAAEAWGLGLYVSFSGIVTFKNSAELRAVAAVVPADRLLVETDSPYLAPHPLRGKQNEPAYVVHTAACVAAVRGVPLAQLAAETTANGRRLFGLP